MEPFADMFTTGQGCVLKVNQHCDACKMKMMEVLSSIIGVYSVTTDARRGLVKVYGKVDPNVVLSALARTGKHAEVVWANIRHPQVSRAYHDDKYKSSRYTSGYGRNYGAIEDPYHGYRGHRCRPSPDPWDTYHCPPYPMTREVPPPEYYHSGYNDSRDLPPARYVPPYPPREYKPFEDEPVSLCSPM